MIGVILRNDVSQEGHKINLLYDNFLNIFKYFNIPIIGIPLTNTIKQNKKIISKCDGIIGQGGDDYTIDDLLLIKYIYDNDIPFLGICLSMQAMGVLFDSKIEDVKEHKSYDKYVHDVLINKDSLLYEILNLDTIKVNSRHKSCITIPSILVSAKSDCIEAIEDKSKTFFMGVQWHPESLFLNDENSFKIFKYFIDKCGGEK
ncbi:MAG: gamma-glutamyl-gamma-aminobutyrate hydrolase family protein [Mycoplasmatota bacterium]